MELGWVLDKVRMPKTMPGQNDWIVSALLGSLVQIQGLCVDGLDSARLRWGHQLPVSELSPALPSTAGLRIIQTHGNLIWSCGRDALRSAGGFSLWIQSYNPSALPWAAWLSLSATFQYWKLKAPGAFVCKCSCPDWPQYLSCSAIARIQFRLPDGSSFTNQFPSEARLEEARQFAAQVIWAFCFSAMCWSWFVEPQVVVTLVELSSTAFLIGYLKGVLAPSPVPPTAFGLLQCVISKI